MASEELPDKLDKLEIAPTLAQVKLMDKHLPISLNPFYDKEMIRRDDVEQKAPQNCRKCRQRRSSESVLDEYKASFEVARSSPGVQRQSFKKTPLSAGANKKIVLRQPVLKALQTCLHPQSAQRKLMLTTDDGKGTAATATGTSSDTATSGANRSIGVNDFRDLISECQTLLEQDVDFSGRLNRLTLNSRNSKNFTTMQTPPKSKRLAQCSIISADNVCSGSKLFPPNSIKRNSTSPSPEHSTASRANTSCSQQAGNGANNSNSDDVTIDELASYFDTFVHIPKKMSSMAEMMYI